jgi:hypothetical protein
MMMIVVFNITEGVILRVLNVERGAAVFRQGVGMTSSTLQLGLQEGAHPLPSVGGSLRIVFEMVAVRLAWG